MKTSPLLSALMALASLSAYALPGDEGPAAGHRRQPGRELFGEFKAVESYSHLERIRILREAEACIQAATDRNQFRSCEQREAQAREQVRDQVKARHDVLRVRAAQLRQGRPGA